jgi:hypothetical protein
MTEENPNSEAVRLGFAFRHSSLRNTRCYHAMNNERGVMYLCGCFRPIRGVEGHSKLGRRRKKDARFADMFRYSWSRRGA